jgi:TrpR family trp operon transcriptional repressor
MNTKKHTQELIQFLLNSQTPAAMEQALRSLLTPAEFAEVTKRVQIFTMLKAGVPQRKIAEDLGVGIATVSRGARALKEKQRL